MIPNPHLVSAATTKGPNYPQIGGALPTYTRRSALRWLSPRVGIAEGG